MRVAFVILLSLLCVQCAGHSQLSTEQKLQDFEFLHQTLKDNFPYFGVAKRQLGLDWLANKDEYRERIKKSTNDSTFLMSINSIVNELQTPHLSVFTDAEWLLDSYRQATIRHPHLEKWVEVAEKSVKQSTCWNSIWWNHLESLGFSREQFELQQEIQTQNFSGSSLVENKIAVMRFNSFMYDNAVNDSVYISSFLEKIQSYKYLIIDIQDNTGGSEHYWRNHVVGRMIDDSIQFTRTQVGKGGTLNRHFFPNWFESATLATRDNAIFPNLPCEILDGSYYISSSTITIMPNDPIPFKGKIFLLVNEWVFSAADGFAQFCKASEWATVVGVRSGGLGSGSEPTLIRLPNSGIIVRHPSVVGLNYDGSFNFETKTVPDIEIVAENSEQRLERLVEYIKNRLR